MLAHEQRYTAYLKSKHQRLTNSRKEVLSLLFGTHGHLKLEDIMEYANKKNISRATLFRILNQMREAGLINKFNDEQNRVYYEHTFAHEHHDHLICVRCGEIIEIEEPIPQGVLGKLCRNYNFTQHYHSLKVFGLCEKCK